MGDDGAGQLSAEGEDALLWCSGPGEYGIGLGPEERALLREIPIQLRDAIASNRQDETFRRLFPPAYADAKAEAEFRSLTGDELEHSKIQALETLSKTADATKLTEDEMEAWLRALNDIRLWLGTVLDVQEDDPTEPDDPPHLLYHVLTAIQSLVIDALSGEL
ncbi:MAG TPA: DUF2017 family protein [Acidimicrobiales bacterium]|nr:DUF2017 family protein [Acidimicrobiales bacterium]